MTDSLSLQPWAILCGMCGFRYYEYNGHIIRCPVCQVESLRAEVKERDQEIRFRTGQVEEKCLTIAALSVQLAEQEAVIESIALALDGLPITGERTGPRSAKYLDFADQIKALRQQVGLLSDSVDSWRNECMNLRQQVAARDSTICGMREAQTKIRQQLSLSFSPEDRKAWLAFVDELFASAPTCSYKEENTQWRIVQESLANGANALIANLQAQLAQVKEALERAYKHWGALNKRRFFLINKKVDKKASKEELSELEGLQEVASVLIDEQLALQGKAQKTLSSHESKYGKVEHER